MLNKLQKMWEAALQWQILEPASKNKIQEKCQVVFRSLAGPRAV